MTRLSFLFPEYHSLNGIPTVSLHDKADISHSVQQGVCVMLYVILQFIPIKGENLIEVDLVTVWQRHGQQRA